MNENNQVVFKDSNNSSAVPNLEKSQVSEINSSSKINIWKISILLFVLLFIFLSKSLINAKINQQKKIESLILSSITPIFSPALSPVITSPPEPSKELINITQKKTPSSVEIGFPNIEIIYTLNNGPVSPDSSRTWIISFTKTPAGETKAKLTTKNIYEVIESKDLTPPSVQEFDYIFSDAQKVGPGKPDSLEGCTGGRHTFLKVLENNKILIDESGYFCGGKKTNQELSDFSIVLSKYVPELDWNFL
ncbi:hypothetical protein LDC_2148 [sediment metagenome]|uniref:Uncharacterized protein n=1 Tax=sediment metagenome TaxID=749907 RepID=D9PKS9_9ZZZZ